MENIFTKENMEVAVENLLKKNDSCGVDGIYVSQYQEFYKLNGKKIREKLLASQYKPSAVLQMEILKKNGKKRTISKYTCTDRVILDVLRMYLTPLWSGSFSQYSYAYQENKGVQEAVLQCAKYIEAGHAWVVELDIKDFFDAINIERVLAILARKLQNEKVLKLIHAYLYIMLQDDVHQFRKTIGLVQGSPLSPLFSNIYMQEFDLHMEKYSFCRFLDNINVYCDSLEEAQKIMEEIQEYLRKKLGLECNKNKCGIYPAISRCFLGYEFYRNNNDTKIYVRKHKSENETYYRKRKTSAIQKIDRNYHLISDGILTRKDYTILFENEEGKYYLPVETCGSINIYSQVAFSSSFFEYAKKKHLIVNMFGKYGEYVGSFYTISHHDAANMMLNQANIYNDEKRRI